MESSTTIATAGMSLQRAECTPPARTLAEPVCREQGELLCAGYHGDLWSGGLSPVWLLRFSPASSAYDSRASPSVFSSMLISLSSLDSKISRHSRHSTNSASSSRLTICTRGCLHGGLPAF